MKLIGVTDDRHTVNDLLMKLQQTEQYFDAFILREKSKTDEQIKELINRLKTVHFPMEKLILHARPDLASYLFLSNVQLTGYGLSLRDARAHFPSIHFGRSVHSLLEAKQAEVEGADWLLYGHVYETQSKEGLDPRGTEELFTIAASCTVPVYAIGGIKPGHLPDLRSNGVAGAAILSPLSCENAVVAVNAYRNMIDNEME
ncbi:thiamine phosphate synthase [Sporosarcina sp.]|uniref:thiamine phosphate synthase n=1 Tax=Sporosarcina sp. TaxID=49982 RepID=UPI002604C9E1|nr:thiamine phosphate synthase [Sporosarcina sp.]